MSRYGEIKKATAEVVGVRVVKKSSTAKAHAAVRDFIVANPSLNYDEIAAMLDCSKWLVYKVAVGDLELEAECELLGVLAAGAQFLGHP